MLRIYKASAGSGKTYRLAYEYIRALLGVKAPGSTSYRLNHPKYLAGAGAAKNQHRHILAITFTNKATEEMKRRIIDELDSLSVPTTESNYASDLCRELGCTRYELAEVAYDALRQLLYDYDAFVVTTIDSFFQRVLRTFARELDRQGDFSIEINDTRVVQAAVDNMLDDFNLDIKKNPNLEHWIFNYLSRQMEEGKKTNFFNRKSALHTSLIGLVARICEETFKPHALQTKALVSNHKNMETLRRQVAESKDKILLQAKELTCSLLDQLQSHGVTFEQMNQKPGIIKALPAMAQGERPKWTLITAAAFDNLLEGRSAIFKKKSAATEADCQLFCDYLRQLKTICAKAEIIDTLAAPIDNLILLGYAWKYYDEFIGDNNLVLISETNHLLNRIIGKDDTPFIYERMGVNFHHFLIDEFQDTSKMQWDNLRPLVANSLGEDYDSLIIGDEKQSIYRFRNSDSSLLHTQVADVDFAGDEYNVEIRGTAKGENTNWRSASEVVRFNNTLFTLIANSDGNRVEGFENVVQDIAPKHVNKPGYVRFVAFTPPDKKARKDLDDEALEQISVENIDRMALGILRQHEEGGYPWKDIAILVQKNKEGAAVIERLAIKHPQIPVISDESLYLYRSQAVQLIVNTLEIIANETSNTEKKTLTEKKYKDSKDVALIISRFAHYLKRGADSNTSLRYALEEESPKADQVISDYIQTIKDHKASSLTSLVETIVDQVLTPDERASQMAYIAAFHDYVADYCNFKNQSINALLNDWAKAKGTLTVTSSSDIDAVRVMTVHKSKGLEFDCVHIPFGSWTDDPRSDGHWVPFPDIEGVDSEIKPPLIYINLKNKLHEVPGTYFYDIKLRRQKERLIDMMNMTYVAYTRAGSELIVYYDPTEGIGERISSVLSSAPTGEPGDARLCDLASAFDAQTGDITFGAPTYKNKTTGKDAAQENVYDVAAYDTYFHDGAQVLTSVDDMLDVDSDLDVDDAPVDAQAYEDDEVARQRGIVLHDMLSKIVDLGDIDVAVEQVAYEHRLSIADQEDARRFLEEMLDEQKEEIYRWYVDNENTLNEQSIYLPEGDVHRHTDDSSDVPDDYRRPDRIVFNHDGSVDVVDYKFTSQVRKSHKLQVKSYMEILQSMGYDRVSGYLWYPFQNKIVQVAADA